MNSSGDNPNVKISFGSDPYGFEGVPRYTVVQEVPKSLNDEQLFRLVEIAHETETSEVRSAALALLNRALDPPAEFLPAP